MHEEHEALDQGVEVVLVHTRELAGIAAVLLRHRLLSHTFSFGRTRNGMNTY